MRFSGAFAAHQAPWSVRQNGTNPAAALLIDSRSYVPSRRIFAVSTQEIDEFNAKSEIGILAKMGGFFGGQD